MDETMKTTIELPDRTFRMAKATAAARGQSLREFFEEAVEQKLATVSPGPAHAQKPWMKHAGVLSDHAEELQRIKALIEDEFERIEDEDSL